jgi:hypothetical protein
MSDHRERFARALAKLLYAHGEWAQCSPMGDQTRRERLADEAVLAENEVLRLYDAKGRRKASRPVRRVYVCEGCGDGNATWSSGRSRFSRTEVPDGMARWCDACAQSGVRGPAQP